MVVCQEVPPTGIMSIVIVGEPVCFQSRVTLSLSMPAMYRSLAPQVSRYRSSMYNQSQLEMLEENLKAKKFAPKSAPLSTGCMRSQVLLSVFLNCRRGTKVLSSYGLPIVPRSIQKSEQCPLRIQNDMASCARLSACISGSIA